MSEEQGRVHASAAAELRFRKEIEEYYLPKQLVDAIFELGEIPKYSITTQIGVAFIDIADYTYISRFLSPNENQAILNGLYAALNWVIQRHGGYLNKIEGDSLMFHYGGNIDRRVRGMSDEEAGRDAYERQPALWADYVEKYKKEYAIDPVTRYREYSGIQQVEFCAVAFFAITLFFETVRRAFYYVIFGKIFPRKRRRRRRKNGS